MIGAGFPVQRAALQRSTTTRARLVPAGSPKAHGLGFQLGPLGPELPMIRSAGHSLRSQEA